VFNFVAFNDFEYEYIIKEERNCTILNNKKDSDLILEFNQAKNNSSPLFFDELINRLIMQTFSYNIIDNKNLCSNCVSNQMEYDSKCRGLKNFKNSVQTTIVLVSHIGINKDIKIKSQFTIDNILNSNAVVGGITFYDDLKQMSDFATTTKFKAINVMLDDLRNSNFIIDYNDDELLIKTLKMNYIESMRDPFKLENQKKYSSTLYKNHPMQYRYKKEYPVDQIFKQGYVILSIEIQQPILLTVSMINPFPNKVLNNMEFYLQKSDSVVLDLSLIADSNFYYVNNTIKGEKEKQIYNEFGELLTFDIIYFSISQTSGSSVDSDLVEFDKVQDRICYNISIIECIGESKCINLSPKISNRGIKYPPEDLSADISNKNGIYVMLNIFMIMFMVILLILNIYKWRVLRVIRSLKEDK